MPSRSRSPRAIALLAATAALAGLAGIPGIAMAERDVSAEALGLIKPTWRPGAHYDSNDPGRSRSRQATPSQQEQGRAMAPPGYAPDNNGNAAPRGPGGDGRSPPPPPPPR
jgi:hypothetical protein